MLIPEKYERVLRIKKTFANDFGSNPLLLPEQSYNNFLFFKEKKKIGGEQTKQSGICLSNFHYL